MSLQHAENTLHDSSYTLFKFKKDFRVFLGLICLEFVSNQKFSDKHLLCKYKDYNVIYYLFKAQGLNEVAHTFDKCIQVINPIYSDLHHVHIHPLTRKLPIFMHSVCLAFFSSITHIYYFFFLPPINVN